MVAKLVSRPDRLQSGPCTICSSSHAWNQPDSVLLETVSKLPLELSYPGCLLYSTSAMGHAVKSGQAIQLNGMLPAGHSGEEQSARPGLQAWQVEGWAAWPSLRVPVKQFTGGENLAPVCLPGKTARTCKVCLVTLCLKLGAQSELLHPALTGQWCSKIAESAGGVVASPAEPLLLPLVARWIAPGIMPKASLPDGAEPAASAALCRLICACSEIIARTSTQYTCRSHCSGDEQRSTAELTNAESWC